MSTNSSMVSKQRRALRCPLKNPFRRPADGAQDLANLVHGVHGIWQISCEIPAWIRIMPKHSLTIKGAEFHPLECLLTSNRHWYPSAGRWVDSLNQCSGCPHFPNLRKHISPKAFKDIGCIQFTKDIYFSILNALVRSEV